MSTERDPVDELIRLRAIEREYLVTVRALAVTVDRLVRLVGGTSVEISDEAIQNAPDLRAWRTRNNTVEISVAGQAD